MAHSFAFVASLQPRIAKNPNARFVPVLPETRAQAEREAERGLEALVETS